MYLEVILAIILFNYLRKKLEPVTVLPKWSRELAIGTGIAFSLIVIDVTIPHTRQITMWAAHGLLLVLLFLIYTLADFKPAKTIMVAVTPFVLFVVIGDAVEQINFRFYNRWETFFDIALVFAIIWMVAMLIINNRQKKALQKEKLKTQEKEKEYKITEALKAQLEIQVTERTATLRKQTEELQHALDELKSTQALLIQSEKMASLGELTAGIAHEIQNPLNFVNNFSEVSSELINEMVDEANKGNISEVKTIAKDVQHNLEKILHHGKRADGIVKGMLLHSRTSSGIKEPTDINALADEYLRLAYHGLRAKDKSFNATMKTDYDETISAINVIPQDIGRVILNLITNAFYAATLFSPENIGRGLKDTEHKHNPTVWVSTKKMDNKILISVRDNGPGIPQTIIDKIFQPFFTTKPTGKGTGLGLSLSYDIIKAHGGELTVKTAVGKGAEFIIILPH